MKLLDKLMKLKKIKTFIVGNPPPHFGGRYWIFVKLITDKNIVGYGRNLNHTPT